MTAIVSQDFGILAKCLSAALQEHVGELKKQWIFVPNIVLKQWLLVQLAKESPTGCVAGYKVCTIDEMIYSQFPCMPSKLEMRCLIYDALETDLDKLELTRQLADLFFSYGKYGIPEKEDWQMKLFGKLFGSKFQLPMQFLPKMDFFTDDPCHFFGFNALPSVYWSYLEKSGGYFYLFSPCIHFWEDIRTNREQARFGVASSDAPRLLANLGKLGRAKVLELDIEPVYSSKFESTMLGALQNEIVTFRTFEEEKKPDDSIRVFRTGASKLFEVETIGREILRLCKEKGLQFSEISLFAPNIQEYVSLIECVFSQLSIPYRFPQIPIQSSFHQGILRIIDLMKGPWSAEKVKHLFEAKSFTLKDRELLIKWTDELFQYSSDWEKGFAELLKKATTYTPGPVKEMIQLSAFDALETLFETLQSLQADLESKPKTLEQWASQIEAIAEKYLSYDEDQAAFASAMRNLKRSRIESKEFPLEIIVDILTQGLHSSYYGNYLHAVCCSSIQEGAVVPARACFLLGMDEESFPRKRQGTSLDLLKKEPDIADVDRYLFLQILLGTKEFLTISYSHISPDDGKQVSASVVVQELLDEWPALSKTVLPPAIPKRNLAFFTFVCPPEIPIDERTISLSDLTFFARHPWKYYLQKVKNIVLEKRNTRSFRALRSAVTRGSLDWPIENVIDARKERFPGIFEEAFRLDAQEKSMQMQKQFEQWGKKKRSLTFYQTAFGNECAPLLVANAKIIGEISHCMEDGALHFGDDHISSLVKVWPEVLTACIALQSPKIYFLKTGKIKTIFNAESALQKFIAYYLRCQKTLSPLIPDWADSLLRNKEFSPEFQYEDETCQWIVSRLELPASLIEEWAWLKASFSELIGLYETL